MITLIALLVINLIIFFTMKEDPVLTEVREKYRIFREHLISSDDVEFEMLHKEIPIVAHRKVLTTAIGYNSNKGAEIGICIDGTANEVFHVLLHELAHCTVEEYSHSTKFWENYEKIKQKSIELKIYENIPEATPFCGRKIKDK